MATVLFDEHAIELNLAYFGPLQAGCGSNVRHLHRSTAAREKSELRRVGGKDKKERMWWFSYEPSDPPRIAGFDVRIRVCSVPSLQGHELDRDDMLAGVDGVVFVCDARGNRTSDNVGALLDLETMLARQGIEFGSIPIVYQVNQSDADNARPWERVVEDLNPFGFPVFEAMARQGKGVTETHTALLAAVTSRLRDRTQGGTTRVPFTPLTRALIEAAEDRIIDHAMALPQAERSMPPALGLPASAEIPVRLAELKGSQPLQHVRTEVRGERLRVTATFKRNDGTHQKLAFAIEPGDPSERVVPGGRPSASSLSAVTPPSRAVLPPTDVLPGGIGRVVYDVAIVSGGMLAGVLLGYIVFA